MDKALLKNLGPLAPLPGIWEGQTGDDIAPSDDRGTETNKYRERMVFEPTGMTQNHEQTLYGLRYSTQAWRLGEADPFHDEVGYWLWEEKESRLMKCILIPRGVAVIAEGKVNPDAKAFKLSAQLGSPSFGILSIPFLNDEFQTLSFDVEMKIIDTRTLSYSQTTFIQIKGKPDVFEHKDQNTLKLIRAVE